MFLRYLLDSTETNPILGEKVSHAIIKAQDLILRGPWHAA